MQSPHMCLLHCGKVHVYILRLTLALHILALCICIYMFDAMVHDNVFEKQIYVCTPHNVALGPVTVTIPQPSSKVYYIIIQYTYLYN